MTRKKRTNRWCFPATALLDTFEEGIVADTVAQALGISRSRVQKWREGTTNFDPYKADHFAIKLGKHPSEIWHDWFDLPEFGNTPPKEISNDTE